MPKSMPIRSTRCVAVLVLGALALLARAPAAMAQVVSESIGDYIVRFYPNEKAMFMGPPSFALEPARSKTGPAPTDFKVVPVFSTADKQLVATIAIDPGTSLYGTGEATGPLLRNGRTVTCWNFDNYGYGDDAVALYESHPWVLAVRPDGTAFGVLADTTYRCVVDLTSNIVFKADGPKDGFPLVIIDRPTPAEVVTALADLTGKIAMPPKWAIGYHQCRYSYYPDSRVREIADTFRKKQIPCDVIWLDIHYMNGFRCFTFDPKLFPNPSELNSDLHKQGFHSVWMIDPGIKAEPGYFVFDQGTAKDLWVKTADGKTDYHGKVWPGDCVFPDFSRQETSTWWSGLYKEFLANGVDGVWNDMNEPAVFDVTPKTMPEDNLHRADAQLGGPGPHARFHNVYGLLMVKATREGFMNVYPDRRPFVLSRASYIGGHRYGAAWTGDNSATWYHLKNSIPMALNMSLSGQPFIGPDIGGFAGDGDGPMFARWMGIGTLLPFARAHADVHAKNKEPWEFGPEVEKTCKQAIERRYRLLPYFYTLFHEAATTGMPIVRPLFFADPKDAALRSEDDGFLLGADILVSPRTTPDRDRIPVLPKDAQRHWRAFTFGDANPDLPDLYLRSGAIVPSGPVMQHTADKPLDPLTLLVNLDEHGQATGTLYEDAGDGWGYRDGEFLLTTYHASLEGNSVTVSITQADGQLRRPARKVIVRVLSGAKEATADGADGGRISVPLP
jgi:alpha-glucosidase